MTASSGSVLASAGSVAVATVASRAAGFGRSLAMVAVLGTGTFGQAFGVANTLPNAIFEMVIGGVLGAALTPYLLGIAADARDDALTWITIRLVVLLCFMSALAIAASPWLVSFYSANPSESERDLTQTWSVFFIPQIPLYGLCALATAGLHVNRSFKAAAWAPFVSSCVFLATLVVFSWSTHRISPTPETVPRHGVVVLGLGTTLAVLAMAAFTLTAYMRARGVRPVRCPRHRPSIRPLSHLAGWAIVAVASTQVLVWAATRVASTGSMVPGLNATLTLWQLPQAVVGVSLGTVLLPRLATAHAAGDGLTIKAILERTTRGIVVLLLPVALILALTGPAVASVLFGHGAAEAGDVAAIGTALRWCSVGLVTASVYVVQLKALYATAHAAAAALIQVAAVSAGVVLIFALKGVLSEHDVLTAVLLGFVATALVGSFLARVTLIKALPTGYPEGLGHRRGVLTLVFATAAVSGWVAARLVTPQPWLGLVTTAVVVLLTYVGGCYLGGIAEIRLLTGLVRRGRRKT